MPHDSRYIRSRPRLVHNVYIRIHSSAPWGKLPCAPQVRTVLRRLIRVARTYGTQALYAGHGAFVSAQPGDRAVEGHGQRVEPPVGGVARRDSGGEEPVEGERVDYEEGAHERQQTKGPRRILARVLVKGLHSRRSCLGL